MKIVIERAKDDIYWYADEVGKTFEVLSEIDGCYCVGENDSLLVDQGDCRIISS